MEVISPMWSLSPNSPLRMLTIFLLLTILGSWQYTLPSDENSSVNAIRIIRKAYYQEYIINPKLQITQEQVKSRDVDGLKSVEIRIVLKNIGLWPLYNMNNIQCKEIQKQKEKKWYYKLGGDGRWDLFHSTTSFHFTIWLEKMEKCFTDGGKTIPCHQHFRFWPY